MQSFLLLEGDFSGYLLLEGDISGKLILEPFEGIDPNGGRPRQEYNPYYYELKQRRLTEQKILQDEAALKSTQDEIESLEIKRLKDLANEPMQLELLGLLKLENQLMLRLEELQNQKLMLLEDDDDFLTVLMYLPN